MSLIFSRKLRTLTSLFYFSVFFMGITSEVKATSKEEQQHEAEVSQIKEGRKVFFAELQENAIDKKYASRAFVWGPKKIHYGVFITSKTHRSRASTGFGFPAYSSYSVDLDLKKQYEKSRFSYGLRSGVLAAIKEFSGNDAVNVQNYVIGFRLQPYLAYDWLTSTNITLSPLFYVNTQLGLEISPQHFINEDSLRFFPNTHLLAGTGLSLRLYSFVMETHLGVGVSNLRFALENDISFGFVF